MNVRIGLNNNNSKDKIIIKIEQAIEEMDIINIEELEVIIMHQEDQQI